MKEIRALALTKYGRLGASSRLRSLQYLPELRRWEIEVTVHHLLSDELLLTRFERNGYRLWSLLHAYAIRFSMLCRRRQFDLVWIEKESLPWFPLWIEQMVLRDVPYVLDFDDAIFHNYDRHKNGWIRHFFGRRLDGLMSRAALVVVGNNYLAQRARSAGAQWVEVLPTAIDLDRYPVRSRASEALGSGSILRIVWIGSPSTARYLELLGEPLRALAERYSFVLRVIGGGAVNLRGVQVEEVQWMEDNEVADISKCDIGVMPLLDSPWEQGKCGYKLIQYMACGLPVVASNVGVNSEIVRHGQNGFLASSSQDWVDALGRLMDDRKLRAQMGLVGRERVEQQYCIQQTGPKLSEMLRIVGGGC